MPPLSALFLVLMLLMRRLGRCSVALATTQGNRGGKKHRRRQLLPSIDLDDDDATPNMVTILNCDVRYGLISKTPES